MRGIRVCICVSAFCLMAMNSVQGAGFDCSKASTDAEKLICSDQNLSALDGRLTEAWRQALKKSSDKETLRKAQQEWIKTGRDVCPDVPCMQKAYEERIAVLQDGPAAPKMESPAPIKEENPPPQGILDEANKQFTFQKQPINPLAVKELYPWLADRLPGPVAVDVAGTAANTNRYLAEGSVDARGFVCAVWTEGTEKLNFYYKRLGTLATGAHVLETWNSGGGTLVSTDLLLVKFMTDTEYTDNAGGSPVRERLLMMRVGAYSLGDRYKGTVEVRPNEIVIGAGGERKKPETIRFR
jgi:uncharacterized protein